MATPTNLPASATAGQVLTAQYVNDLRGAFRVLQVVQGSHATGVANNTNVLADTGLTATITPQATSSKILVLVNQQGTRKNSGNAGSFVVLELQRGGTKIFGVNGHMWTNSSLTMQGHWDCVYLDSPNTTSATTYKTQFCNGVNAAGVDVQASIGAGFQNSTITLIEISA
jgi:hypothetical protein